MGEIVEAFEDEMLPEDVTATIARFIERRRLEQKDVLACEFIQVCNDTVDLSREGGIVVKPDPVIDAAIAYLKHQKDRDIVEDLDYKIRIASLYVLATLEAPYTYQESTLFDYLSCHPIDERVVRDLMKEYVDGKFGLGYWKSEYDKVAFRDLYDQMTYFDGEPVSDVLTRLPIFQEVKDDLLSQGFGLGRDNDEGEIK